jgi:hypothetical protein
VTLDTILGNIELTEGVGAGGELPGTGRAWEGYDILVRLIPYNRPVFTPDY